MAYVSPFTHVHYRESERETTPTRNTHKYQRCTRVFHQQSSLYSKTRTCISISTSSGIPVAMKFAQILTVASGSLHTALALPPTLPRQQTCTSPKLRKEWSQATAGERSSYIQAVLCLATKPSTLGLPSPATVYDDFSWAHATLNNESKISSLTSGHDRCN